MTELSQQEEVLQLLRNIHENQLRAIEIQTKAIEMQSTQLALAQSNIAKSEVIAAESMKLQKLAVQRQHNVVRYLTPVLLGLIALIIFNLFAHIF